MSSRSAHGEQWLPRAGLDALLSALKDRGYTTVGPRIEGGAIVYDEVDSAEDLPAGWSARQEPGVYRLTETGGDRVFDYAVGPHSWKKYLHEPVVRLFATGAAGEWKACPPKSDTGAPTAMLGVRPCELAAIDIQDRVFTGGPYRDPHYASKREGAFLIGVDCTVPSGVCFCSSMGTGPKAKGGFDLAMTELDDGFIVRAASDAGQEVLDALSLSPASKEQLRAGEEDVQGAATKMGRDLDTAGLPALLNSNLDHPRWKEVADRCLSCGNCTMVCPTCFCTTVEDVPSLVAPAAEEAADGQAGEAIVSRTRRWDSCFSESFSYTVGGNFRQKVKDRYRQWMTHKLSSWHEQFGTSGCVGCGRCISWCPVGIDITEEAAAIRETPLDGSLPAGEPLSAYWPPPPLEPRGEAAPGTTETGAMVPCEARVIGVYPETSDTFSLSIMAPAPVEERSYGFAAGQFNMLYIPEVGEAAISVSSNPLGKETLSHTIRACGTVTRALQKLKPGDRLGLRGPFGTAWPVHKARGRDLILVAGGIGLAPLRPVILQVLGERAAYNDVTLIYGARTPQDLLFSRDLLSWATLVPGISVKVTVDTADINWSGNVGVVTELLPELAFRPKSAVAMVCGPEVMMRFVSRDLLELGLPPASLYLSLERNMKCAIGVCGHCQYGSKFICKDGPVFAYPDVSHLFGLEGI